MKKWIAIILLLVMTTLAACSGVPVIRPEAPTEQNTPPTGVTPPAGGDGLRTGLALVPTVGASRGFGEKNGLAQSDITMVAVLVDENGVIVDCVIDSIQAKVEFNGVGRIITDMTAPVPTKNELGDAYGMKQYSGIGKEWNEQAAALAEYATGKTVEALKGIALNDRGAAAEADLAASVTVSIGGYLDAIALAVENSQNLGARRGDSLKLTAVTTLSGADASAEKEGNAQAYATVSALSFRGNEISSCVIDAVQCDVKFDTSGALTSDTAAEIMTKNQLGDDYGMKKYSGIGKEWYEQAAGFAAYVTGRTVAEVEGISLTESGTAADVDLASSVTINLGAFLGLIRKAGS